MTSKSGSTSSKRRLLMILGAGSSVPCGMPSVATIDNLMKGWAKSYARATGAPDYFAQAWEALEQHSRHGFAWDRQVVTFERVLSDLVALMHWLRPPPAGGALRSLIGAPALPPTLTFAHPDNFGPYLDIKATVAHLLDCLAREMRLRCHTLETTQPELLRWRSVLGAMREQFEVVIYNLNYDTVALSCWADVFTGFDEYGRFAQRRSIRGNGRAFSTFTAASTFR
ncbi:MAG: hypothetical protein E2586_01820 [Novosphingobium sp.]|uniref:hypothetical protein n=1 Tax=Novosphingobium sp. TaxID=1874826 RepID=UPI0012C1432C|nr:hypothetical protein [Novosphingobium sp.]MPS67222.1 hypothetical protein [Novosphingobium sp.]